MAQLMLIYGKNAVLDFLKQSPELVEALWIKLQNSDPVVREYVKNYSHVAVHQLTDRVVEQLFPDEKVNHQGLIAKVRPYKYLPSTELFQILATRTTDLVLILDRIQDPHNFGAIIRSAVLMGVKNIIMLDHDQVDVTATVVKTSAGTVFDLAITKVINLNKVTKQLKSCGYWLYASNLHREATDIRQVTFVAKTVLIVGNEGKGVTHLLTQNSDMNVYIPTLKTIDSLNVAAATAIMLFVIATNLTLV